MYLKCFQLNDIASCTSTDQLTIISCHISSSMSSSLRSLYAEMIYRKLATFLSAFQTLALIMIRYSGSRAILVTLLLRASRFLAISSAVFYLIYISTLVKIVSSMSQRSILTLALGVSAAPLWPSFQRKETQKILLFPRRRNSRCKESTFFIPLAKLIIFAKKLLLKMLLNASSLYLKTSDGISTPFYFKLNYINVL